MKTLDTYTVRIYMAGDVEAAKQIVRRYCYLTGFCVTVEPTTFIYTGGEESGFILGCVNYPRYPSEPAALMHRAEALVRELMAPLNQRSALLVASDKTVWITEEPPGATVKREA